jgi:hypothetical protein
MRRIWIAFAAMLMAPVCAVCAQGVGDIPNRPIRRSEIIDAARRLFVAMDANHDGSITPAEFDAYRARNAAAASGSDPFRRVGAHWFERADADRNGRVTQPEAAARPLMLFDMADADHNGVINLQERKMATLLLALKGK